MVELLQEQGHGAAISHYSEPSIRTDACWSDIVAALKEISSSNV